jgi:hypothetical protein
VAIAGSRVPFSALTGACQTATPTNSRMIARGMMAEHSECSSGKALASPEKGGWLFMEASYLKGVRLQRLLIAAHF